MELVSSYKYRRTLNNHLLKKHSIKQNNNSDFKKIKCKVCDKMFTLVKNMEGHMRTIHSKNTTNVDFASSCDTPELEPTKKKCRAYSINVGVKCISNNKK